MRLGLSEVLAHTPMQATSRVPIPARWRGFVSGGQGTRGVNCVFGSTGAATPLCAQALLRQRGGPCKALPSLQKHSETHLRERGQADKVQVRAAFHAGVPNSLHIWIMVDLTRAVTGTRIGTF